MEKILKNILILSACFLLTACASSNVWQTNSKLTPRSYNSYPENSRLSTGLLRRLLIMPVQFETLIGDKPFFQHRSWWSHTDSELGYSSDEEVSRRYLETAVDYLANWKGYEIIRLNPTDTAERHALFTSLEIENIAKDLMSWSEKPVDYETPAKNIIRITSKLGSATKADGILMISGVNKLPSDAKVAAVVLSASLLWPILFIDTGISFKAHIFEVNTGKVVWASSGAPSIPLLFEKLENAIPKVMTR